MAFLGQDGFYWGMGVVEDRFDPEKLNRVRVRWLGIHDDAKEKILTKDLTLVYSNAACNCHIYGGCW